MLNEKELRTIAQEYGTPCFVFDKDILSERIREMRDILGEQAAICYAMKANPFLVDAMKTLVSRFEVCSPGEFEICAREQVDMKQIVLSGVNKEKKDIERVMDTFSGVGIYTAESVKHFLLLAQCAKEREKKIKVLLRLTSGNQFGMEESAIEEIIAQRDAFEWVEIVGLQCYSGTQKKKLSLIENEMRRLDEFCDLLKEKYGFAAKELEYGPGLSVSYFQPEIVNNYDMLKEFAALLAPLTRKYAVTLEMGRFIAATCGFYLTRIMDRKTNHGQNYLIVDGGINHVNYYGQTMAMKIPEILHMAMEAPEDGIEEAFGLTGKLETDELEQAAWNVCGSLCTTGDVLVKNLPLKKAKEGDVLVFCNIGAYSVTEGIYLFLSRRMPQILAYSQKGGAEVLREAMGSDIFNSRKDLLD